MNQLRLEKLYVQRGSCNVLIDCSITLRAGELVGLTGANGAGKTTLARTITGSPECLISSGRIYHADTDITELAQHKRARRGIFASWQQPPQITGLTLSRLICESYRAIHGTQTTCAELNDQLEQYARVLGFEQHLLNQQVNTYSAGQCKASEILQLLVLKPYIVVLDEIDAGLDKRRYTGIINALLEYRQANPEMSFLIMSHQEKFLSALEPTSRARLEHGRFIPEST